MTAFEKNRLYNRNVSNRTRIQNYWRDLSNKRWLTEHEDEIRQVEEIEQLENTFPYQEEHYYFEFERVPANIRKSIIFKPNVYILCNVEELTPNSLRYIHRVQPKEIPLETTHYSYRIDDDIIGDALELTVMESFIVDKHTYWLSARTIYYLLECGETFNPINNSFSGWGKLYIVDDEEANKEFLDIFTLERKLICSKSYHISM